MILILATYLCLTGVVVALVNLFRAYTLRQLIVWEAVLVVLCVAILIWGDLGLGR